MRISLPAAVVAVGLCLLVAGVALADGTTEHQTAVKLYRGLSIVAASDPNHPTYRPGFTMAACLSLKTELGDAEKRVREIGVATYKCQLEERDIISFHPAPNCGDRPEADEQELRTCPTGTVGTWLQDRAWTLQPHPNCWVQGDWTPSEPPEGMCAPADSDGDGVPDQADECPTVYAAGGPNGCPATPPENRAPSISGEAPATAVVGELYSFTPTASDPDGDRLEFRIGSRPAWMLFAIATGRISGTPPAAGTVAPITIVATDGRGGSAQLTTPAIVISAEPSPTPEPEPRPEPQPDPVPAPTGTATLRWTPPAQNTDGSSLTNLAGYRVHYGQTPGALVYAIQVANPGLSSYAVGNLAPGTYYFAVRAYTTNGTESSPSNVVSKSVR